jgi:hypothetical protein
VNCCVENYSYVHRRLLYRDVGKNLSTPEIQKAARPIPVGRRRKQRQAELRQTQAKERERTRENQRQKTSKTNKTSAHEIPSYPIQDHYQYRRPRPFLHFPEYHRVLSEMVTKRWGARGCRKEVRARLHREWCPKASDRWRSRERGCARGDAYRRTAREAGRPSEGEGQLAVASYQQDQETWHGPEGS